MTKKTGLRAQRRRRLTRLGRIAERLLAFAVHNVDRWITARDEALARWILRGRLVDVLQARAVDLATHGRPCRCGCGSLICRTCRQWILVRPRCWNMPAWGPSAYQVGHKRPHLDPYKDET